MELFGERPDKQCVVKPDLTAPGTKVISCNGQYTHRWKKPYISKSGTSMATPVVAGAIACLLSKYPDMTNVEVKLRLRESCLKEEKEELGWGKLNMKKLNEIKNIKGVKKKHLTPCGISCKIA